jgi:hypothetical protein
MVFKWKMHLKAAHIYFMSLTIGVSFCMENEFISLKFFFPIHWDFIVIFIWFSQEQILQYDDRYFLRYPRQVNTTRQFFLGMCSARSAHNSHNDFIIIFDTVFFSRFGSGHRINTQSFPAELWGYWRVSEANEKNINIWNPSNMDLGIYGRYMLS